MWPMNFTTPNSPLTNTFIPVSRVTSGREESERGAAEEAEWGAGLGVEAVRGCLAREANLWGRRGEGGEPKLKVKDNVEYNWGERERAPPWEFNAPPVCLYIVRPSFLVPRPPRYAQT